ncbi:MAG: hypothetical protein ACK56F_23065, partial [bacterium]
MEPGDKRTDKEDRVHLTGNNPTGLHHIYMKQILILVIPISFVTMAIFIKRIILFFIYRNPTLIESN